MLNAIQQGILRLICSIAKIYETEVIRELIFRKITVNTFCPGDATKKGDYFECHLNLLRKYNRYLFAD